MKVVIDTNIWISYLLGGLLEGLDEKILSGKVKVIVSEEMLKELSEISNRPKFKNIFTDERLKELFSLLDSYAIMVSPTRKVDICRDRKDNFLLEVAAEGKADYLITGDEDLIVLNKIDKTRIIKSRDFEKLLE